MAYKFEKNIKTLELLSVLELLSNEASMADAQTMALELKPSTELSVVSENLKNTEDAYLCLAKNSAPTFGRAVNVIGSVARADLGSSLSIKELLEVAEVLRITRSLKDYGADNISGGSSISRYFEVLTPNKFLESKINFAIKSEDELSDSASPLLADIRRKITIKSASIRDNLERIVRGPAAKYLQENIITQRDGRFVVPVKAEHKSEIKGLVHDTSATGSTLFIEPMSVVETNNEIRVLKLREQDEIVRILAELSSEVATFAESIKLSYNALVKLNFIFAKAQLAYKMKAIVPKLNTKGYVYLKRARHPLIPARSVVPITVSLGGEYNTLIITGPNTGGKTVTLKTVGLLSLMAMCGLMVPADDGSEIAVFNKVFADIGDEQSIEQSLSTFSSHMVNIISVLAECDQNSLVLFDELCAGTDPIEGAALAKAILMKLHEKNVKTVATTHYAELKSYAIDEEGVENASCEFDVATLKPTYRLIIGIPGRSNAFSISKKLGLDADLIEVAKEQISDDDRRFERVVASLESARLAAEKEHSEATRLRAEAAELKRQVELRDQEFRKNRDKIMSETREKATHIVEDARNRAATLLNSLEDMKKQLTKENASKMLDEARRGFKKSLENMEDSANPVVVDNGGEKLKEMPKVNDLVVIANINRDATVLAVDEKNKKVQVVSGSMKMWVKLSELRIKKGAQSTERPKTRKVTGLSSRAERSAAGEIDLRGMASDEAILELDKYIDNAVLSGIGTVTIIHGKGTGVLRKAVQDYLRHHKSIKTFRIGLFGEGENGVTIAEIAE